SKNEHTYIFRKYDSASNCPIHSVPNSGCHKCFFDVFTCFVTFNVKTTMMNYELDNKNIDSSTKKHVFFRSHAIVILISTNSFWEEEQTIIIYTLISILKVIINLIHKKFIVKLQSKLLLQEISMVMSAGINRFIIITKSIFSSVHTQEDMLKINLQAMKCQLCSSLMRVLASTKLDFN
uniref:Uncharacterized protein n=1 Tax=Xenopus tropicalis TaxID=8364 RepID=A0A803JQ21_XENTR